VDAARQVLRFSIPGSILLLMTTGLLIGGRLLQGETLAQVIGALAQGVAAAIAILAAIPVGFLVYQVYYLGVRPFVWLRFYPGQRRWPRVDRGARVLMQLGYDGLQKLEATYGLEQHGEHLDAEREATTLSRNPLAARLGVQALDPAYIDRWRAPGGAEKAAYKAACAAYDDRWRLNWDLLGALVEASSQYEDTSTLKVEYLILTDVYHALGACRTACTMAWTISTLVVIAYLADGHGRVLPGTVAIVAGMLLCLTLWLILNQTRRQTWKAAERMLGFGFRRLLGRDPDFLNPGPASATTPPAWLPSAVP
jgi:hypothetical protein